jgi:hypothetical protein
MLMVLNWINNKVHKVKYEQHMSAARDTRLCGFGWLWLNRPSAIQVQMPQIFQCDIQIMLLPAQVLA